MSPPTPNTGDKNTTTNKTTSAMEKKVINDAMAYITSLAQLRDRNISWALLAVKEGKSLSARDALKYGVIDLIAQDYQDLLRKIHKKEVEISGKNIVIDTTNTTTLTIKPDWKSKLLMIIANPNVAYIFILLGVYGIIFELMNPGSIFPGVVGAVSGVLALYSLNILPFNYAGLILIFLGIAFMISELFIAGVGILGIGGVVAFAFGSFLLFDSQTLGSGVSIPLILAFSLVSFGFFLFTLKSVLRSRQQKAITGEGEMIGKEGVIEERTKDGYRVFSHGEIWSSVSEELLEVGDTIVIKKLEGLTLHIEKKDT